MITEHAASPLSWPAAWPRTSSAKRHRAKFYGTNWHEYSGGGGYHRKRDLTISEATSRLQDELCRIGARSIILSTNLRLRNDGLPYSGQKEPEDPGAAVYFTIKGKPRVLAVDKWDRCADNIAALAKTVEALRGLERWGVGDMEQRFSGYKALPEARYYEVLGVDSQATREVIENAFRRLAKRYHPDNGGDPSKFREVVEARLQAIAALPT